MRAKNKLICGIGINDASYEITRHTYKDGKRKIEWVCPIYKVWKNMHHRCASGASPTYDACSVHPDWIRFSEFYKWMKDKDYLGKDLDKDILFPGNKVYGPDTCIFVSHAVNSFILDRAARRGPYLIGVNMHAQTGKFRAKCRNPITGKCDHLGLFSSEREAHNAWKARKHQIACSYAENEPDQRLKNALMTRFSNGLDD